MPFIPHTDAEVKAMLGAIGATSIEELFEEIPQKLLVEGIPGVPEGLPEMALMRLMSERANADGNYLNFIGAGAYEHHIPAAVWQIATRGEFYSAYTPYQAEASQGTLQVFYEFQSMMASLTGLDVCNASLYDGASALAEAVLMAVRAQGGPRRVLMPRSVHPYYRDCVRAIVRNQGVEIVEAAYSRDSGATALESLGPMAKGTIAAVVAPQPNFFGVLEPVDELTDWAHAHGALAIGLVNPLALALLKPPGEWGSKGADIAVGDGQPLGAPLSGGGPYLGFMCARQSLVRQMPGRIVGRSVDAAGAPAFTLTLQAREQHIRRAKATSNICTNQGLMAIAATIHLALLGPRGLERTAACCHTNALSLCRRLTAIRGVTPRFSGALFHEAVLSLPCPAAPVLDALRRERILGGFDLSRHYPELGNALLVCATETKTQADLDRYAEALQRILAEKTSC
ncbi:MAG: aminomethyl-transferring glycine dehydrogenase subunit GcvPA [Betaproteobacteria bacterium]|nr:aminomethyl-transferring glycine dehydrogenase subunit GcvPA [Betaproteobacteria bacterium]